MTVPTFPVLSDPALRLLLLTSRPLLSPDQVALASDLVPQVTDWGDLMATAQRKYSLPMVFQNLASNLPDRVESGVMQTMRLGALGMTAETLRRHAAFTWYHRNCVAPVARPYAYFKGPALAFQFYAQPVLRYFRDFDILVGSRDLRAFTRLALDRGCRIWLPGLERIIELSSDTEFEDYVRFIPTAQLVTPQGVMVEIHREIDPVHGLFDTASLLARAHDIEIAGLAARTLPDAEHLAYLCVHHGRHLWSKLNWLADLDACTLHSGADLPAARHAAQAAGLDLAFQATMAFREATAQARLPADYDLAPPPAGSPAAGGIDLLKACILNLPGDKALEVALREGPLAQALYRAQQGHSRTLWPALRLAWRQRAHPNFHDIRRIPGGEGVRWLRHGAAMLPKMGRSLLRLMGREVRP